MSTDWKTRHHNTRNHTYKQDTTQPNTKQAQTQFKHNSNTKFIHEATVQHIDT